MHKKLRIVAVFIALLPLLFGFAFADGENIIVNGDFEQGGTTTMPMGWYVEAWNNDLGAYGEYVKTEDRGNVAHFVSQEDNDARMVQLITVEPETYYSITCDIKCAGVKGAEGGGANISVLDSFAGTTPIIGDVDWNTVSFCGVTKSGQKEIKLALRIGNYGAVASGEAWFDNVVVVKLSGTPSGEIKDFFMSLDAEQPPAEKTTGMPNGAAIIIATLLTAVAAFLIYKFYIEKPEIQDLNENKKSVALKVWTVIALALLIRVIVNFLVKSTGENPVFGHSTDINCFMSWGETMLNNGPAKFYEAAGFADYPPGYMYILWLCSAIRSLFGIPSGSALHALVLKLPSIIADIALSYMIFRIAKRFGKTTKTAILFMCLVAFNPLMIFISAGWGQIDQLLALGLVASFMLFIDKPHKQSDLILEEKPSLIDFRKIIAGFIFGLTILIKPQALMVGPLFAVAYFVYIFTSPKGKRGGAVLTTILSVVAACLVIFAYAFPFKGNGDWSVLIDKYIGTATSYPYASVEAFNFMALIGGNWAKVTDTMLFGLSYEIWGWIFMGIIAVGTAILYIKGKKKNQFALVLCAALLLAGFFTFGQYMHERYLFPVLALILVAAIAYNDKRLYISFGTFTASMFLNSMAAFIIIDNKSARYDGYGTYLIIGSLLTVLSFIYFAYVCIDILIRDKTKPMFLEKKKIATSSVVLKDGAVVPEKISDVDSIEIKPITLPDPVDNKLHFTAKDRWFSIILTVVYCVIALLNLGTTQAPETHYNATVTSEPVVISFGKNVKLGSIYVYGGIEDKGVAVLSDNKGTNVNYTQEYGNMFRWHSVSGVHMETTEVTLRVDSGKIDFCELAFFDIDGKYINATASASGLALVDEPKQVPAIEDMSYMNGMYFDELYHGRTAYEHLNNLSPYENSHPPLGKIFISIGVAIFGMNAFGWRIIGTLFGVAMVPLMYCLGKRLFKKSEYALLTAFLFAFDLMHFAQTRIATVDVYAVFFIILMFYYMYQYYTMNFYVDGLKKTLKPLGLAGLFFGLGAASKWICIYAGFGLALILMFSLIKRYKEYKRYNGEFGTNKFAVLTIETLAWCCLFYLLIPGAIYFASYTPYFIYNGDNTIGKMLKTVSYYQGYMFSYHSGLTDGHAFASSWYEWPLIFRPVWFYVGSVKAGFVSTISTFGSPAVWWPCFAGTVALGISIIMKKIKMNKGMVIGFIGILANLGAWVLVTRCTFEYHYFATVPFIIILTVSYLKEMEDRYNWLSYVKWGWIGLTGLVFAMFYPFVSGLPVPSIWMRLMQWLPGWTFVGTTGGAEGYIFGLVFVIAVVAAFVLYGQYAKKKAGLKLNEKK